MGDAATIWEFLMIASAKMGMDFVACAPKKYFPNAELVLSVRVCKGERCNHHPHRGCKEGTKDADVIYTDVWVSMGEPDSVWKRESTI